MIEIFHCVINLCNLWVSISENIDEINNFNNDLFAIFTYSVPTKCHPMWTWSSTHWIISIMNTCFPFVFFANWAAVGLLNSIPPFVWLLYQLEQLLSIKARPWRFRLPLFTRWFVWGWGVVVLTWTCRLHVEYPERGWARSQQIKETQPNAHRGFRPGCSFYPCCH